MTDRKPRSQASSSKKLKSSPTADDNLSNCSTNAQEISKKKNETGNENEIVLLYPNSSCSPEESVFLIDHILESIFAELDRPTLINCRLVSRRWAHLSSTFLQKIITFKISANTSNALLICNGFHNLTIKDLTTLMNNAINFPFPCTSFLIPNFRSHKTVPLAQRFLSAHGPSIKKLTFDGHLPVSDLKRLLLTQTPNLKELHLNGVRFPYTAPASPFSKSSKDRKLFSETPTSELSKPSFKNLKVFTCNSRIPDIFLQQLLECSPNLTEVFLKLDYLHCLVQPVNRLHLLKKLVIAVREANIDSLEAIANNPSDNWAIQEIQSCYDNVDSIDSTGNLAFQAAEALSKILKGCSATCRTLSWKTVFEGFRIPRMVGVRHFSYEESTLSGYIFPEGVSLGDTFPNLRSLEMSSDYYDTEPLSIKNVLDVDDPNPVPLPNVRKVSLNFNTGPKIDAFLREMFPNAVIETPAVQSYDRGGESDDEEVEIDDEEAESDDEDEDVESD